MSFLQEELINYASKAWLGVLGSGDRSTAPDNLTWYEEITSKSFITLPQQVWIEHSSIPPAPDLSTAKLNASSNPTIIFDHTSTGNVIHLTPSPNNKLFFTTTTYGDLTTRLYNWLMPQLIPRTDVGFKGFPSIGYMIKFYNGNPLLGGTEIPTTQDKVGALVGWWMNFAEGAIKVASSFSGIVDPTDVWMTGFRYVGKTVSDISVATEAETLTKDFICDASMNIGDVVYESPTTDNKVETNTHNKQDEPSIGIVIQKPTPTTCKVLTYGPSTITFSGLNRSKRVFLSSTGSLTTTRPSMGYIQIMGHSYAANKIYVAPQLERVKRNPF